MQNTRYTPGNWLVVAGPNAWLLADLVAGSALAKACWDLINAGAGASDVLGAIAHEGLRAVPGFVLIGRDRVLVRGVGWAEVLGDSPADVRADNVTWIEHPLDHAAGVRAHGPDADGTESMPLIQGIAYGGVLEVQFSAVPDVIARHAPVVTEAEPEPAPQQPAPGPEPVVEEQDFRHMFESTSHRATVTDYEYFTAPGTPHQPVRPAPPEPVTLPPDGEFIASLSWLSPDTPPVTARIEDTAMRPRRTTPAQDGPDVLAIRCPAGHLNSPDASGCRVCAAALLSQEPVRVQRPCLGRLVVSNGATVDLDRSVLLGRLPTVPDGVNGDRPHSLSLGAEYGLSRDHAEVRVDGWRVLVVDLGSTNGTLLISGRRRLQLEPHVPVEIGKGDVVSLTDDLTFRIEVG